MVKPPIKTPKKATKTNPKKAVVHQDTDNDPLFPRNTVVAIPGREADLNFKLVKLLDDVYEETENVQVLYLKPYEDPLVLNCYYEDTIQGEISDRDIICNPELQQSRMRIKGKGMRAFYKISRQNLNKVKSLAKNFEGVLEDGSEESEESEAEEVAPPARPVKKVAGRKGTAKKMEEQVEEEEKEKAEPVSERGTRGPAKKTEEVTRSTKKKKVAGEKGKSTKDEDIDDEEEEKKENKSRLPTKHKKRIFNPNVEVIEHSEMLESEDSHVIDYGSTRANNKNVIRAVYTRNHKLLEECLAKEKFFSTFFQKWGVDTNFNAFDLALKQGDEKTIQLLCNAGFDKDFKFAPQQRSHPSKFSLERVAALNKDEVHYTFDYDSLKTVWKTVKDKSIMDFFFVNIEGMESHMRKNIETILLAGNWILAGELVKRLNRRDNSFGFTKTHELALTADDPEALKDFKGKQWVPYFVPEAKGRKIEISVRKGLNITPIHFACINPNGKILGALLEKCPDYNITDSRLRRPVHYAAACESSEPLALLLKNNVDYKQAAQDEKTPLMIAAQCGRTKNIELLLKQGDESIVSDAMKDRMDALHFAVENGHLEVVKLLVKNKANIEYHGRQRMTALILAAAKGHFEIVQYLLDQGAKINAKDEFKRNAFILAIMNGNIKIASYLLKYGADFLRADSSGNNPLHYAAAYGWIDCLDLLMKAGADQNQPNSLGWTPLAVSFFKNNIGCMKKLLSYPNTDVNCRDESGGTIVMSAIQNLNTLNAEQIRYLIQEKNADPNLEDSNGNTALHHLASLRVENLVKFPYSRDESKRTRQIEKATGEIRTLQFEVLQILLEAKADPNKKNYQGGTPFVEALQSRNFSFCDALLNVPDLNLASVNKRDETLYHLLAPITVTEDGSSLFNKIADQLGNPDALLNQVDILGFTPILKFIKNFAQSINGVRNDLIKKILEQGLDRKQKEWSEVMRQEKPFAKESAKNFVEDESEDGEIALGDFGFDDPDERPVHLKEEEIARLIEEEGEPQFEEIIDRFVQALKRLVELGANPNDSVQKLRPFRNEKISEVLRQKMLAVITKKRQERQTQANYSDRYNQKQQPIKISTEYCPQGNQNALHLIQRFPHPKIVEFLLSSGSIPINQQDYLKRTPLHLFVKHQNPQLTTKISNIDVLELLLKNKADPNILNIHKESPFFLTLQLQKPQFFEHLLNHSQPELNLVNSKGETPLIFSVKGKHLQFIQQLLKAGADPNIKGHRDRTALHYALNVSEFGADASFEIEYLLIKYGARINQVDSRGRTPLHYAFVKINGPFSVWRMDPVEIVVSYCTQNGYDVNVKDQWGCTPLHYAAQRGAQVCAATLINNGANINEKDVFGNTPLAIALRSNHQNVAIILLQNKAEVDSEVHVVETDLYRIKKEEKEKVKKAQKLVMEVENSIENEEIVIISEEDLYELEVIENEKRQNNEEVEFDEDLPNQESGNQEEKEDQAQSKSSNGTRGFGSGNGNGGFFRWNPWSYKRQEEEEEDTSNLEIGSYSLFTVAIRKNRQDVAYLLLQSGYDFMSAIQDAFNQKKFNYVEDKSALRKTNAKGQNLFHIFAIQGSSAPASLAKEIYKAFDARGIDYTVADSEGRTPLHYAAMYNFEYLIETLLQNKVDINIQDAHGYTPFVLQLISETGKLNDDNVQPYLIFKANLNLKFKVKVKDEEIWTGPLNYLISSGNKNYNLIKVLVNSGASINELDENGYTPLMHAIRVNSISLVKYLLNYSNLDKSIRDKEGKTPIHHVVQPLEYGSFENEKMLEILAAHFDVNEADSQKKTPIYYAHLQDDGIMVQALKDLGAQDIKTFSHLKRAATSVIASVDWPKEEVDYEEDAEKFLEEARKAEKDHVLTEEKIKPDEYCQCPSHYEVVYDDKGGAYDVFMAKVTVGGNLFYRMQVLHQKVRNYYTLYTRNGSLGKQGKHQNSSFPDKESAIKEFNKIFKSKSGNEWTHKDSFEKQPYKYQLVKFTQKIHHKEYLVPLDLTNPKVPQTTLDDDEIKTIIHDITNVKMYQKIMLSFNVDTDILPLARLSREILNETQNILFEISELLDQIDEERKISVNNRDKTKIVEYHEKISEKSRRFFELIPDNRFRNSPAPSIENRHILGEKRNILDNLIDFEISSKIILGALSKTFEVNPLDYCYQALSIKMISLQKEHSEYTLIKKYIGASHPPQTEGGFIKNIFALERRGEAERISQHKHLKNKMLLWHGSKMSNFMGILAQGLRIVSPEGHVAGQLFGRGIYFSDSFKKSYACTENLDSQAEDKGYRLLLLCEVALGEMKELLKSENITQLKPPFKSVKGVGLNGPKMDHKIVMPNGCIAPIGQRFDQFKNEPDKNKRPHLECNEFVVYDVSQVRIRYLVQVKSKN